MNRPHILRLLKIAFTVGCGILCLLLVVLWVQTYQQSQEWDLDEWMPTLFRIAGVYSVGGELKFAMYDGRIEWTGSLFAAHPPSSFYCTTDDGFTQVGSPHWFIILFSGILGVLPWIHWPRRFDLRTLLITTTLVAVLLGAIVHAIR
jgi:hypothetical protein